MRKIISLCLIALVLFTCMAGCGSSKVPSDVSNIIITRAESLFKQSAEIITLEIVQEDPAQVEFTVRLADGREFPGNFVIGHTMTFAGKWQQSINFYNVEQTVLDNWSQIVAIAEELNLRIKTPEYVDTGINPSVYYSTVIINIFMDSKNQFDAVAEFLVTVNSLLNFDYVSAIPLAYIYLGNEESHAMIAGFSFDSYPMPGSADSEKNERRQNLVDKNAIASELSESWMQKVASDRITDDGQVLQEN